MIDPRKGFSPVNDAYALSGGARLGTVAPVDDLLYGLDWDMRERVFAVVRGNTIGIRGTDNPIEAVEDAMIIPVATEYGNIAMGVWSIFKSFRTMSGRPLSAFAGYDCHGHSLGAGLAAILSVALQGEHCLWECPNWFGPEFRERFMKLLGYVFAVAGDVVPFLGYPPLINPRLGPITHLLPPIGTDGILAHHEFATCIAAFELQFPIMKAA